MKRLLCYVVVAGTFCLAALRGEASDAMAGIASWYGNELRGNLMANGRPFDPEKLTAASWFYPLGTRVRVTRSGSTPGERSASIIVTITDRGPARRLVEQGRIIDLAAAAFEKLANRDLGLIDVIIEEVNDGESTGPASVSVPSPSKED
jgi:rare lipoprotein A